VEGKDLDALMALLTIDELCQRISVGQLRPNWAVLRPCNNDLFFFADNSIRPFLVIGWDVTCDRHLLLGIFKHGYGRFDLIRDDPMLIFESKLKQALEDAGGSEYCGGDAASAAFDLDEDSKTAPTAARSRKSKKGAHTFFWFYVNNFWRTILIRILLL